MHSFVSGVDGGSVRGERRDAGVRRTEGGGDGISNESSGFRYANEEEEEEEGGRDGGGGRGGAEYDDEDGNGGSGGRWDPAHSLLIDSLFLAAQGLGPKPAPKNELFATWCRQDPRRDDELAGITQQHEFSTVAAAAAAAGGGGGGDDDDDDENSDSNRNPEVIALTRHGVVCGRWLRLDPLGSSPTATDLS